jgi:hypothetical protein
LVALIQTILIGGIIVYAIWKGFLFSDMKEVFGGVILAVNEL